MEPTDDEIRKVLAEFMGWMSIPEDKDHRGQYALYGWWYCSPLDLPDYTHDLNSMHEVEAELERRKLTGGYVRALEHIIPINPLEGGTGLPFLHVNTAWQFATATASERARAAYAVIKAQQKAD